MERREWEQKGGSQERLWALEKKEAGSGTTPLGDC